jgi:formiminotetrahydrofolate cyclodeaminase
MFTKMPVNEFLDALASKAPVPGGGSGAALGGALAAGLLSMVCNLTIGKKGYEEVEDDMREILARSEELRKRLPDLLEADTRVYSQVMDTYRMPRGTEEEKVARTTAMQSALKSAAQVPLQIAECCASIIEMCLPAAHKGNKWAVSDAGVAALMGEAALRSAALNVWINLGAIADEDFVEKEGARLDALLAGKSELKEEVFDVVRAKL